MLGISEEYLPLYQTLSRPWKHRQRQIWVAKGRTSSVPRCQTYWLVRMWWTSVNERAGLLSPRSALARTYTLVTSDSERKHTLHFAQNQRYQSTRHMVQCHCNHPVRVLSTKMRCHVSEKILKQRHMQCLPTLPIGLLSLLTPKDEYC